MNDTAATRPLVNRLEWMDWGACRDEGVNMFPTDNDAAGTEDARGVCAKCPVLAECLAYALDRNEWDGVWGGLTGDERRVLKRGENRRKLSALNAA